MSEIYLKIYTEDDGTLVFEGQGEEDKEGYWPTRWDDKVQRFGTVAVGANHISITKEAKEAIIKLVNNAHHTGDDISCVDVSTAYKRENGKIIEETPTDVSVSYMGPIITKINVDEAIKDDDFFIGCGEGAPRLELLDALVQV